jgi:hypothetical protein
MAVAKASAAQTGITFTTWTTLTFGAEAVDTDGIHDNVTNNSRLTLPLTGKWLITGSIYSDISGITSPTKIAIRFLVNGSASPTYGYMDLSTNVPTDPGLSSCAVISASATDYVEMQAIVLGSAGTWATALGGAEIVRFSAFYIGE